ncbi:MAG: hypothetical protein R2780_01310 [Crocinitomicaceae bacterium]|nr:hypothetical protein [Crocinitomicaceae bacterium]
MPKLLPFLFIVLLLSCKGKKGLDITEEEIDEYVASCLDTSKIYDILAGLRYSRNTETYQVTEYSKYDTAVLNNSQEITEYSTIMMNYFYKEGLPVYIEEFKYMYEPDNVEVIERKIYLDGYDIIKAYERRAEFETEIDGKEFEEVTLDIADYDLERPERAIHQEGEFELKFDDFLIINPESYLILENKESGYGVALFIIEGDMLLDELYSEPKNYQGKTIEVFHEFMMMNGIERMIYRGGIVKE